MTKTALQVALSRLRNDPAFRQQLMTAPHAALAEYDLTEAERDQLILPNFSWVVPNAVAGTARPFSPAALTALAKHGIRAVVTLTEEPLPADAVQQAGLTSIHLPIVDLAVPTLAQAQAAVTAITQWQAEGKPVAVHCAAGVGRTGTILACYLVSQGAAADDAISTIRRLRPGSIETPEQEAFVRAYAAQQLA